MAKEVLIEFMPINNDSSPDKIKTSIVDTKERPVTGSYLKPASISNADLNTKILEYQNKMRLQRKSNRNKVKVAREIKDLAALVKIRKIIATLVKQYLAISKGKITIDVKYVAP